MKKIWSHIIIGVLFFNLVAYSFYVLINKGSHNYERVTFQKLDLLFGEAHEQDLLFIGSSRAYYGVNVFLLEKLSGKKCLNGAFEGAKVHEMETILKGYLSVHKELKEVFIMVDPHSLTPDSVGAYNKIVLANYLSNDTILKYMRITDGKKVFAWKFLPYSILTEFDDYTRACSFKGLNKAERFGSSVFHYKGFVGLHLPYKEFKGDELGRGKIYGEELERLKNMMVACTNRGIKVTLLPGAFMKDFASEADVAGFYTELQNKLGHLNKNIRIDEVRTYDDRSLFTDQTHLNHKGAHAYTVDLYKAYLTNGR